MKCQNHKNADADIWVQIGLNRYFYCNECWGKADNLKRTSKYAGEI